MVEEDNTPLAVTVTPCDAPLEWKLSVQELPEETSGEGSGNKPSNDNRCTSDICFPSEIEGPQSNLGEMLTLARGPSL